MEVEWTTEYRQQMDMMSKWGASEWYRLNRFLQYVLWTSIAANIIQMSYLFGIIGEAPEMAFSMKTATSAVLAMSAVGAFLILKTMSIGFYLAVIPRMIMALAILLFSFEDMEHVAPQLLAECVFLSSCLLLTNRCNISAYELLWPKEDAVRPIDYLEKHAKNRTNADLLSS